MIICLSGFVIAGAPAPAPASSRNEIPGAGAVAALSVYSPHHHQLLQHFAPRHLQQQQQQRAGRCSSSSESVSSRSASPPPHAPHAAHAAHPAHPATIPIDTVPSQYVNWDSLRPENELYYFTSHPYQYFTGPTPPIIQMPMESEHASTAASPDEAYQPYPPPK